MVKYGAQNQQIFTTDRQGIQILFVFLQNIVDVVDTEIEISLLKTKTWTEMKP